jgi:peptide/nickel transport system substrate-binding protein
MRQPHEVHQPELDMNRREFLAAAGSAAVGVSALSLTPRAAAAADKPSYGGSINIGLRSDISRLDPHPFYPPYPTSNAMSLIYNGMTEADYDLNVIPALAHHWETSKDGLTWTWHIRQDVTFHNGRPMTAEDIKANVERVLDPKIGALVRGELEIIDKMELLDKYTLRMILKDKYYPLPAMLTNRWVPIIDPQALDSVKQHPIGTGPSNLSPGNVCTPPSWPAMRRTGKRTRTATRCPTWMRSSASHWPMTPCASPLCAPVRWT